MRLGGKARESSRNVMRRDGCASDAQHPHTSMDLQQKGKTEDRYQCPHDDRVVDGTPEDDRIPFDLEDHPKREFVFEDRIDNIFFAKPLHVETEFSTCYNPDFNPLLVDVVNGDENDLKVKFARLLDCKCHYIQPCANVSDIIDCYNDLCERGSYVGITPILVGLDSRLFDSMCCNFISDYSSLKDKIDLDELAKKMCSVRKSLLENDDQWYSKGKEYFLHRWQMPGETNIDMDFSSDLDDFDMPNVYDLLIDPSTGNTRPLLIALIPTGEAWKIFGWLPCTGNLDLPVEKMMCVACYWEKMYSAVPMALIDPSTIFFRVRNMDGIPDKVDDILREHMVLCPDLASVDEKSSLYKNMLRNFYIWMFKK